MHIHDDIGVKDYGKIVMVDDSNLNAICLRGRKDSICQGKAHSMLAVNLPICKQVDRCEASRAA